MSADLRPKCTPIRDQANCGSCTAFGTLGAWEELLGGKIDLSERHLFFCAGGGCNSGNTPEATFAQALKGVCLEECLPYGTASIGIDSACENGICSEWWTNGKKLASWMSITDIKEMKDLLDQGIALPTTMTVHQSFMNYVSGVYHSLGASDPIVGYHMICTVGYDDEKGAWLIRNSWGIGWGEAGYVWIKYGDSEIDSTMYQLVLSNDQPDPTPGPTPSPCTRGALAAKILNFIPWLLRRKGRFFYMNPPKKKECNCGVK